MSGAADAARAKRAQRRRFTAAEKLRVLREADRCTKPGELSARLRREGLYSSHLSTWRAARTRGELAGLRRADVARRRSPWTRATRSSSNRPARSPGSRRG